MRLWDWLTAGPKAAEKVLDGAISGIDKLVLTEEERIDARQQFVDSWLKLQATLGEETTVRGVTRRLLALLVVGTYVFLSLFAVAVWNYKEAYANFIWEVANAGQYGYMTLAVVVFYFGPYVFERLFGKGK